MRGNKLLKTIDRYIGIPIIYLLGIFRIKRLIQETDNIAFLMSAALGDTLLFASLVKEAKEKYPDKRITLFCGSSNKAMAEFVGGFDLVELINTSNPFTAIKTIRKYSFDVFVDCGQWPRLNAILTYFAKASFKIGFKSKGQFKHYVYDQTVEHLDDVHENVNFKNLLRPIFGELNSTPKLYTSQKRDDHFVIFHLCPSGERSYLKEWPLENWQALAEQVLSCGYKIFLTGGPDDFSTNQKLMELVGSSEMINLAGKTNLHEVVDYLGSAKCVVSVNTGIMHMAAATDVPLIALHGPTNPLRWGPLSEKAIVITPKLACSPCLNLGFEYGCDQNLCMQDLNVERVFGMIKELLQN